MGALDTIPSAMHWASVLTDRRVKGMPDPPFLVGGIQQTATRALAGIPIAVAKRELDAWKARTVAHSQTPQ